MKLKKLFRPKPRGGFLGRYASYVEAAAICTPPYHALVRYDLEPRQDTITSREQQILAAFALSQAPVPPRVLDFGGATGSHFRTLSRLCDPTWTIVETPEVAAKCIAEKIWNDRVVFVDTIPSGPWDFILASGAIQYVDDPYATLRKLLALDAPICINRLPIVAGAEDWLTVQHYDAADGSATRIPAWFFSEERFRQALAPRKVVADWLVREDIGAPGPKGYSYKGLLIQ